VAARAVPAARGMVVSRRWLGGRGFGSGWLGLLVGAGVGPPRAALVVELPAHRYRETIGVDGAQLGPGDGGVVVLEPNGLRRHVGDEKR